MRAMVAQLKSDSEDLQQVDQPFSTGSRLLYFPVLGQKSQRNARAGHSERVEEPVVAS